MLPILTFLRSTFGGGDDPPPTEAKWIIRRVAFAAVTVAGLVIGFASFVPRHTPDEDTHTPPAGDCLRITQITSGSSIDITHMILGDKMAGTSVACPKLGGASSPP